jgi:hypothetical protein
LGPAQAGEVVVQPSIGSFSLWLDPDCPYKCGGRFLQLAHANQSLRQGELDNVIVRANRHGPGCVLSGLVEASLPVECPRDPLERFRVFGLYFEHDAKPRDGLIFSATASRGNAEHQVCFRVSRVFVQQFSTPNFRLLEPACACVGYGSLESLVLSHGVILLHGYAGSDGAGLGAKLRKNGNLATGPF